MNLVFRWSVAALLTLASIPLAAQPPRHYIVGIDRSASRSKQQMDDMRAFAVELTKQLNYGDAISFVQLLQARSDQVVEFRDVVPPLKVPGQPVRREVLTLNALKDSFGNQARRMTDTVGMKSITTTDIIGFLRRASGYARTNDGRKPVIIVLSDMLQSIPTLDFERLGSIPDQRWIESQARKGLLPNLKSACVVAVGAEEGTPRAVKSRDFWFAYVKAAGAILAPENYRSYMNPSDIRC